MTDPDLSSWFIIPPNDCVTFSRRQVEQKVQKQLTEFDSNFRQVPYNCRNCRQVWAAAAAAFAKFKLQFYCPITWEFIKQ